MATLEERINNLTGEMAMTPQPMETSVNQIQQNFTNSLETDKEMQDVEMAKQEVIKEIFMPLANEGYGEIVNILLTKPINSKEHDMASRQIASLLQREDPEFDAQEFDLIIKMVSKEPRPADLINREGLPDAPPKSQEGIGTLR